MTMPSWPAELVRPLREGYQQQRGDNRRFASGEQGPPRVRRGVSKAITTVPMSFYVTSDQRARFWRFYIEETEEGALPFIMPDWTRDEHDLLTAGGLNLLTHDDVPLLIAATWAVLFGQSTPNETPMGVEWRINFDVMVLP